MLDLKENDIVKIINRRRAHQWEDAIATVDSSPYPVRVLDESYECIVKELRKIKRRSKDIWWVVLIPHKHDRFISNTIHIPVENFSPNNFGIQSIEVVGHLKK